MTFPTPSKYPPGGFAVRPDGKAVAHFMGGNRYTIHVQPVPAAK